MRASAMQPSNYPRPVINEIRFSVIGEAWEIIKANFGPFIVSALIVMMVSNMVGYMGSLLATSTMDMQNPPRELMPILMQQVRASTISMPFTLLGYALAGPFIASMIHMAFKHMSGQKVEMADVTWGVSRFVPFALATLLTYVMVTIGVYLCIFPAFIAGGLTMLVLPAMVVQGLSPFDALSFSFGKMSKFLFMAAVLYFVLGLVSGLGVIACCIGILVTFPIATVGTALVYRDLVGMGPVAEAVPVAAPAQPEAPAPEVPAPPQEPGAPSEPEEPKAE
ncbi:MAG: hypothetical protein IT207_03000 [Fimbriimonadaceae bacterium]|nr:hypothetical protein [Fimbriimonadaceae bacterium]